MCAEVERALNIPELRARFLRYTRQAYGLLPFQKQRQILDIGCGSGAATLELARLSDGKIVAIDIDRSALDELRSKIERENLSHRVTVKETSLADADLPKQNFDLLWEEGVLHVLNPIASLEKCNWLLKPGGFLVLCEIVEWFEAKHELLQRFDFEIVERLLWSKSCWWDEFYAPLEQNIERLRQRIGDSADLSVLKRYEDEIEMVKKDPKKFDCGHFLLRKRK